MCKHGFGSSQVDFGGRNSFWSAIENIALTYGHFTKNTGWLWMDMLLKSNNIDGINFMGLRHLPSISLNAYFKI